MADGKKRAKGRPAIADPRFAAVAKDPRFHRFPQSQRKVEIDPRFAGMFNNPDFQNAARVDKRGRKVKQSKTKEDMQRYYRLPDPEDDQAILADGAETAGQAGDALHAAAAGQSAPAKLSGKQPSTAPAPPLAHSVPPQPLQNMPAALNDGHTAKQQSELKHGKATAAKAQAAQALLQRGETQGLGAESSDESDDEEAEAQKRWARMRGLGVEASSSSSEDEDIADPAEEDGDVAAEEWGVGAMAANPNEAVPMVEDATHRLACVDLDWDHVRAVDILAVLLSFLPKGSSIRQVAVHLSDYGKERLADESRSGPQGVFLNGKGNHEATQAQAADESDDGGSSSGDEVDRERVAQYEKAKLRYYFAIVECSSAVAADALYRECDGMEFEHSSNALDLRFVPGDKEFSAFEVRDTATHVPADYIPAGFSTAALQHTNVKLTWDDDDDRRKKMLRRRVTEGELQDEDLRVFMGSDDEQDEPLQHDKPEAPAAFPAMASSNKGTSTEQADKYRQLLLGGSQKQPGRKGGKDWGAAAADSDNQAASSGEDDVPDGATGEMEVTFVPGLDKLGHRLAAQKQAAAKKGSETVWDAYLRKQREKRLKARASGKRAGSSDDDEDSADEAMPAGALDAEKTFSQQDADAFDDPFFQNAEATASAGDSDEEAPEAMPKSRGKTAASGSNGSGSIAHLPTKSKQKGQQQSREERKLAAEAERQRRAELELLLMDDTALRDAAVTGMKQETSVEPAANSKGKVSRKEHIRAKKEAKKLARQAGSDDDDLGIADGIRPGVDVGDSRFQRLFTSPDFALDPTNPQFKQTAGTKVVKIAASQQAKKLDPAAPSSSDPTVQLPAHPLDDQQGEGKDSSNVKAMVAALKRKATARAGQQSSIINAKRKKDRHRPM
ncbi:hypothetical protein WJX74_005437 [Apatococcus lobatus]|uniref:NUC153 domain-containing protein n=1 Tax=Apatococcus lobatus TaxID=904363 RepID=A0AAW1RC74_9CHLO